MKIEDLERTLIGVLRTGTSGTIAPYIGQTGEFIYVDYPRLDATMPRISLTLASSAQSPAGIGANVALSSTLGVWEATSFDIDIWVHRSNKTSSPVKGGTSLRDYLGDTIVDILLGAKNTLRSYGIVDIEKTGETVSPYDEDNELFRKTITILVTHLRTYQG